MNVYGENEVSVYSENNEPNFPNSTMIQVTTTVLQCSLQMVSFLIIMQID